MTSSISKFALSNLDSELCERRWYALSSAMTDAFREARFMPGFDIASPIKHTLEGLRVPVSSSYRHVLAEAEDQVLAGAFRVPVVRLDVGDADPGWFFVAHTVPGMDRVMVADAVVERSHQLMRDAGFTRVVTNMGTRDGAAFLRRRHGYRHEPVEGQENRWIRPL